MNRPAATTHDHAIEMGAAHFSAGRLDAARALCVSVLESQPRHFLALHLAAAVALRNSDLEDCVAFASRALEVDPRHVEVLCNRGAALRRLNEVHAALADYAHALGARPTPVPTHPNPGDAPAPLNPHPELTPS